MQLGASGSDSPLIQGPAGWHCAATPPSLFYVWALDKRRLRGGVGGVKGDSQMLRMSFFFFFKKRDLKANGGHTWPVQFGTASAHD